MDKRICYTGVIGMGIINFKKPIYKLEWDRAEGTIIAYDKNGHLVWGVAEGRSLK
jgi:hypothetical protein